MPRTRSLFQAVTEREEAHYFLIGLERRN